MAPTYRERLRLEGGVLAATGLAGAALLVRGPDQARRWPLNTAAQLAVVAAALARFGPKAARAAIEQAQEVEPGAVGSGEPTPLWHVPAVVAAQALAFKGLERLPLPAASRAGWDASLRITLGSTLVGLAQALLLERAVAEQEVLTGRTYYRAAGSRLGRGTPLVYTR